MLTARQLFDVRFRGKADTVGKGDLPMSRLRPTRNRVGPLEPLAIMLCAEWDCANFPQSIFQQAEMRSAEKSGT
jgi:hypothetical protein